jgi:drug/metabolite transporter (DMT)-like permease
MPSAAPTQPPRGVPVWIGMLVLYLVWGSTYLAISIAVETIPPFLMAAVRFTMAGLILLTWSVAREGRAFVPPTRREWRDSAIVGALLLGGGMGMVAFGEQTIPSGIAALLIATMPVWVAILGRIFLGERLPRVAIFGIVLGFAGVAILVGPAHSIRSVWRQSSSRRSRGLVARSSRRTAPSCRSGRSSRPASR